MTASALSAAGRAPYAAAGLNDMLEDIGRRLGARLREVRNAAGLTQAEVAERLGAGVAVETISRFERGALIPSFPWLDRLARCYGVSVEDIVVVGLAPSTADERQRRRREIDTVLAALDEADLDRVAGIIRLYLEGRTSAAGDERTTRMAAMPARRRRK